ncbi:hypothetical protein [Photobacterium kishitanii]|uniref:Uncharacterized protein n=1 Tax=Photobacterium kishitanii TaxID=318456 RepID=A0A2T3KLX0_9GAMM|nr:hypothetical protein [Photobacterium kishitanii]PSV00657.1 hypothetical protein C9J27_05830 [Photobacterium kishitanii]
MIVNFVNVGADDLSWEAELDEFTYKSMFHQVKTKGGVMSNSIDFTLDEDQQKGSIVVGMFRKIGEFEIMKTSTDVKNLKPKSN